jgi:hypothetical protein
MAYADNVNMYFVSADGNSSFGEYVYPYYVQVDGGAVTNMMCDTLNRNVGPGDSWTANGILVADLNSNNVQNLFYGPNGEGHGSADLNTYLAAAYLYNQAVLALADNNSDALGLNNWATWNLFDPTDVAAHLDPATLLIVQGLDSTALAAVLNQQPGDLAFAHGTYIYTPTDGVGQEFFGPTPEPGTLLMLGSGALGMVGFIRRKLTA